MDNKISRILLVFILVILFLFAAIGINSIFKITSEQSTGEIEQFDIASISTEEESAVVEESTVEEAQVEDTTEEIKDSVLLDVPIVEQFPELPTGCEIVSVTMLFNYLGIDVDKMTLVGEVSINANNANEGYVGDPRTSSGYTIYPLGLSQLLNEYIGNYYDLTGASATDLEYNLSNGKPIVVWLGYFKGYILHAVILTGYDSEYFYYNDPVTGEKNAKILKSTFLEHWSYESNRALTY